MDSKKSIQPAVSPRKTYHRLMPAAIILILFIFINSTRSQINQTWKWVHPKPQGNQLEWFKAFDASNWISAGHGGTFIKTTDAGITWSCYTNAGGNITGFGHGNDLYGGWFFNSSTGFICGTNGWIAKTTNGGVNWDSLYSGTPKDIYGLYFINSTTGFAAGGLRLSSSGVQGIVLKTTNGGASWDSLNYLSTRDNANNIFALNEHYLFVALDHVIYSSGQFRGLQISTDGGANWTSSPTGPEALYDVLFLNPDTGLVCGNAAVKRTTNGGVNWTSVIPPGTGIFYRFKLVQPSTIYVCSDGFCYRTTNLGSSWTTLNPSDPALLLTASWLGFDVSSNTMVAAGSVGLMSKSTNNGANWTQVTSLAAYTAFADIWCETGNGKVWAVGYPASMPFSQVIYSGNGGTTWTPQSVSGSFQAYLGISMINGSTGYICGTGGEVAKTTNSGTNWNALSTSIPTDQNLAAIDFINESTGWVFSNSTNSGGNIWKTTNAGSNWVIQNSGLTGTDQIIYAADMIDANTGWFVNEAPGRPYKTTNGGTNWVQQTIQGSFSGRLNDIKMLNALTGYVCGGNNELPAPGILLKTTNGGATAWETVPTPFANIPFASTDWVDVNNGVIASGTGLTAKTTNGGTSWALYNTSAEEIFKIQMRAVDTMYAVPGLFGIPGAPFGILKFQAGPTGNQSWENSVPKNYFLSQNYPNPFNPSTTIKFGLPKAGNISLKIYDITGRLVETLINNMPLNAGTVTQVFEGSRLASGIYFYTLTVDDNPVDTKKMVLVK